MILLLLAATLGTSPQKLRQFFPLDDARVPAAARDAKSCLVAEWSCTLKGVMRRLPDGTPEYLFGKRYLPDDHVTGIYVESPTRVWFKTPAGFSRVEWRPMTLEQKAAHFETGVYARHEHEGFIRASEVARLPVLAPHDNDGLWTAIYIGAEAFRYSVTRSSEARARARKSMEAVMRLESVTGIVGFPARAMIRKGEFRHDDGVWRPSPDGQFEWKSDTSSDEVVGHFFAFAVYYDLVATPSEKPAIRAVVSRIMKHMIEHNYALIDWTGKPTTWAQYSAGYLKDHPEEMALNRMLLLSHLLTAYHITGDPLFLAEYKKLIAENYHLDIARYIETRLELNYSDEEMAMLGFYPLLQYEKDSELRKVYLKGLDQWWENEKRERNPLWIAIHNACTGGRENVAEGRWTLERIPMDLVEWRVENSWRPDLEWDTERERAGHRQTTNLLPPDERPVMKWNANPFVVDGGNGGRAEDDGAFYLLPYWMGRKLGYWQ